MQDPLGIVRYVSRIIQDEIHEIETDDTTSESDWSDDGEGEEEAEKIRTDRAFLEFEAKTLELNLLVHDDLEQTGIAAAVSPLCRYYEERFSEVNSCNVSGMLYPNRGLGV